MGVPGSLARVLDDVKAERAAQDALFGPQEELPDGTGPSWTPLADEAKALVAEAASAGMLTRRHILHEEVLEAFAETSPTSLRNELVQVAAVAVKWVQLLDKRTSRATAPEPLPAAHDPASARGHGDDAVPELRRMGHDAAPARHRARVSVHALLLRDARVLLGRRAGTGFADGMWHLPSGHVEAGEDAVTTLVREIREELGVDVAPADLRFAHVMHMADDWVHLFFAAEQWVGEPVVAEPDKCSELAWWEVSALPPDTVTYAASAVRQAAEHRAFSTFGWPTAAPTDASTDVPAAVSLSAPAPAPASGRSGHA
ncbi:NUDIX hydrolase [Nonomuraea soli]|nr:NUDIX domain-containing protein [Nonomuraea soli]